MKLSNVTLICRLLSYTAIVVFAGVTLTNYTKDWSFLGRLNAGLFYGLTVHQLMKDLWYLRTYFR